MNKQGRPALNVVAEGINKIPNQLVGKGMADIQKYYTEVKEAIIKQRQEKWIKETHREERKTEIPTRKTIEEVKREGYREMVGEER